MPETQRQESSGQNVPNPTIRELTDREKAAFEKVELGFTHLEKSQLAYDSFEETFESKVLELYTEIVIVRAALDHTGSKPVTGYTNFEAFCAKFLNASSRHVNRILKAEDAKRELAKKPKEEQEAIKTQTAKDEEERKATAKKKRERAKKVEEVVDTLQSASPAGKVNLDELPPAAREKALKQLADAANATETEPKTQHGPCSAFFGWISDRPQYEYCKTHHVDIRPFKEVGVHYFLYKNGDEIRLAKNFGSETIPDRWQEGQSGAWERRKSVSEDTPVFIITAEDAESEFPGSTIEPLIPLKDKPAKEVGFTVGTEHLPPTSDAPARASAPVKKGKKHEGMGYVRRDRLSDHAAFTDRDGVLWHNKTKVNRDGVEMWSAIRGEWIRKDFPEDVIVPTATSYVSEAIPFEKVKELFPAAAAKLTN